MKETLEEAAGKSFEEIWASLTTEQSEYLKGYINKKVDEAKKWQAEQMYSEEEILNILSKTINHIGKDEQSEIWMRLNYKQWFEQFKKK